jgi:hypothetical protein
MTKLCFAIVITQKLLELIMKADFEKNLKLLIYAFLSLAALGENRQQHERQCL